MGSPEALPYGPDPQVDFWWINCRSLERAPIEGGLLCYVEMTAMVARTVVDQTIVGWHAVVEQVNAITDKLREAGHEPGEWTVYGGWW